MSWAGHEHGWHEQGWHEQSWGACTSCHVGKVSVFSSLFFVQHPHADTTGLCLNFSC